MFAIRACHRLRNRTQCIHKHITDSITVVTLCYKVVRSVLVIIVYLMAVAEGGS